MKVVNIAVLDNIIQQNGVAKLFAKAGGIKVMVNLLGRNLKDAYTTGYSVFRKISGASQELAIQVIEAGFVPVVVKLFTKPDKVPVEAMENAIYAVHNLAMHSEALQKAVSGVSGLFEALYGLFKHSEFQTCVEVLLALTKAISRIVANVAEIQNKCIETDIACALLMIARASKYRELQTSAVTVTMHF